MSQLTIPQAMTLAEQARRVRDFGRAIALCQQVAQAQPNFAEAHNLLGVALLESGKVDEAAAAFRQALSLKPDWVDALNNLGNAHLQQLQLDEAIAVFRKAIAVAPDFALAHYNLGRTLLQNCDLPEGFAEYEWRWRIPGLQLFHQQFPMPPWDGSPLNGRAILIREEQGFGDAIHFVRYAELVADRGGQVIIACRPELLRLFKRLRAAERFRYLTHGDQLLPFQTHATVLSLPAIFKTSLQTIPADIPYLSADPALVNDWKKAIGGDDGRRRIGVVWAGASANTNDPNRSLTLERILAPLAQIEKLRFFSLQKGEAADQARTLPPRFKLEDHSHRLNDFADTAAAIANLDLVITVDTAVAHLAGAMGKPVWVILPVISDWRWMLNRSDTPWYPTMRLFRQPALGDWQTPIEQMARELKAL
jgi:tetratricopeptide (TPR) repeat protein